MKHDWQIPNLSCGHCVAAVTRTVHALDAQAKVDIDLPARRVQVESDVETARIVAALTAEGYAPKQAN
ncbi:MAG: heavy-metal-associated domain-containing protein [Rubrivivax sp.]|jgi:copper chaperone|nr:heavy-metal-associated domain-containing protein [Rubrivivax sp.]